LRLPYLIQQEAKLSLG